MTLPTIDFETYSEAGYVWDIDQNKWAALPGAPSGKKGLPVVGAAVYATHPSTEVLCLVYDLGAGPRLWRPGHLTPDDLFGYVQSGGLLEAWNSGFEHWIWNHVCVPRYGWPPLPQRQLRCAMARARAHALPGSLEKAGEVVGAVQRKDPDGKRLLKKFSMPRQPTAKDGRIRIRPDPRDTDTDALYQYCAQDIAAEADISARCPEVEGEELEYWLADQAINYRGVAIDQDGVANCIAIIDEAHAIGNARLYELTGGAVARVSEVEKLTAWLHGQGVHMDSLDEEHVMEALKEGVTCGI
jgi:DNA polymerase bacteriophage-type